MLGDRRLLTRWIWVFICAEAIGFGVAYTLGQGLYGWLGTGDPAADAQLVGPFAVLTGIVEGAALGTGQWLVLRRAFPKLSARWWIGATALGAALAWSVGMLAGHAASEAPPDVGSATTMVLGISLEVALLFALPQTLVLRRAVPARLRRPAWIWVPANVIGWMIGLTAVFSAAAGVGTSTPAALVAVTMSSAGALMAVAPAIFTGLALLWLERKADVPAPPARGWADPKSPPKD